MMQSRPFTGVLHGRRIDAVKALDLFRMLPDLLADGAVVIAWSPSRVVVGTIVDRVIKDASGGAFALDEAYGVRAFDADRDVRWSANPDGGFAAVISEQSLDGVTGEHVDVDNVTSSIVGVSYVVAGEKYESDSRWTRLSAARYGSLAMPVSGPGRRVGVKSIEYVVVDEDGNADVVDERLVGLEMLGEKNA
jgi:CRISPR-associated protein (TIGR03984 family)